VPLATRQNATNAMMVCRSGVAWNRTPADAGAENTRTFFTHCFGRASRISPTRRPPLPAGIAGRSSGV